MGAHLPPMRRSHAFRSGSQSDTKPSRSSACPHHQPAAGDRGGNPGGQPAQLATKATDMTLKRAVDLTRSPLPL
jgi:hypothetical protein